MERAVQLAAVRAGEIEITDGHADLEFARELERAKIPLAESPAPSVIFVGLNTREPILKDAKVRTAMSLAVNRRQIAESLDWHRVEVIDFVVPPQSLTAPKDVNWYPYDPMQARRLLAEARFSGRVTLAAPGDLQRLAEVIAASWEDVGIGADVKLLEVAAFRRGLQERTLGTAYVLRRSGVRLLWDADFTLYQHVHSKGTFSTYQKPEIDRLIDTARREFDVRKRAEIYAQVAQLLKDDPPFIPLFQEVVTYGVRRVHWKPRVDGLVLGSEIDLKG
jgi:peptide/nickel transport system substrate-binding protein